MHTVELMEQALEVAKRLGYSIRQDSFAGSGGGPCELNGRKLLFLDLDLTVEEQLDIVTAWLRTEPMAQMASMSRDLRELLRIRKVA
jgi:hypothetical protein